MGTARYDDGSCGQLAAELDAVVVSSQHAEDISLDGMLEPDVRQHVIDPVLAELHDAGTDLLYSDT